MDAVLTKPAPVVLEVLADVLAVLVLAAPEL